MEIFRVRPMDTREVWCIQRDNSSAISSIWKFTSKKSQKIKSCVNLSDGLPGSWISVYSCAALCHLLGDRLLKLTSKSAGWFCNTHPGFSSTSSKLHGARTPISTTCTFPRAGWRMATACRNGRGSADPWQLSAYRISDIHYRRDASDTGSNPVSWNADGAIMHGSVARLSNLHTAERCLWHPSNRFVINSWIIKDSLGLCRTASKLEAAVLMQCLSRQR